MDINKKLEQLLDKYIETKAGAGGWRRRRRNQIYEQVGTYILRWLHSALDGRSVPVDDAEVVSMSWDVFEKALAGYERQKAKPNNKSRTFTLLGHFYRHTLYHVRKHLAASSESYTPLEEAEMALKEMPHTILIDLKEFKASLPTEYQDICVDLMTGEDISERKRVLLGPYKLIKYSEARKVLKHVLAFFLKENSVGM